MVKRDLRAWDWKVTHSQDKMLRFLRLEWTRALG